MIFVILGTQDKHFKRLLKEIEKLVKEGIIQKKVIVQAGSTPYQSEYMEVHSMISRNQFLDYIEKSDYVITHGGVGTILDAKKCNKKIIAVPRLKKYNEHENDHQLQIIDEFSKENYIIGCHSVKELKKAIEKIDTFEPTPCNLGNDQMKQIIKKYIETTTCKRKDIMIYLFYSILALFLQMILYHIGLMSPASINMWTCWLISYILLISLCYLKKNILFEIIWGVFLGIGLLIWFQLSEKVSFMIWITIIADILTFIGHSMFYVRRVK